ncbi:hypothetical protein [Sphingomonas sp.]|uniref:MotE family protein n=1 Tax=Sphingomonas sp. TaxID=28214 RepID=UPI001B17F834|nr:hypothetical protein [Sphingomonas sp.]MBO9713512.1 hypothetical protein [Sphingomonas sp.]
MIAKPSLLMMTALVAGVAAVANGVAAATPTEQQDSSGSNTRLGNEIAQDLSARDQAAAQRKRSLDMREQAAAAAEARLKAEADARAKAPGGANGPSPEDAQYDDLARIYQAMKPAKAAIVFEQLSMEVQMKVAKRMRANSTAAILGAMTPKGAAALSMALARGSVPPPQPAAAPAAGRTARR